MPTVELQLISRHYDGSATYEMTCQGRSFQVDIYESDIDGVPDWVVDIWVPSGITWTGKQGGHYPTLDAAIRDAERHISEVMKDNVPGANAASS